MQNARVVTSNKKTVDPFSSQKPQDFGLDPLPVPEALESNTDTAWGLWEDTLEEQKAGGRASAPPPPDFEDTVAFDPEPDPDPLS